MPVGWRIQKESSALDPSHITPRSPVSAFVTKAPARSDGQALARRTACLIPGRVPSDRGREAARGVALMTSKRCTLSQPHHSPLSPQHQLHQSASPPERAVSRPAHYVLDSGLGCPATAGPRLPLGWRSPGALGAFIRAGEHCSVCGLPGDAWRSRLALLPPATAFQCRVDPSSSSPSTSVEEVSNSSGATGMR